PPCSLPCPLYWFAPAARRSKASLSLVTAPGSAVREPPLSAAVLPREQRSRLWRLQLLRSSRPCRRSEHPWPRPSAAVPSSTRCSVPPGRFVSHQVTPSSAAARG